MMNLSNCQKNEQDLLKSQKLLENCITPNSKEKQYQQQLSECQNIIQQQKLEIATLQQQNLQIKEESDKILILQKEQYNKEIETLKSKVEHYENMFLEKGEQEKVAEWHLNKYEEEISRLNQLINDYTIRLNVQKKDQMVDIPEFELNDQKKINMALSQNAQQLDRQNDVANLLIQYKYLQDNFMSFMDWYQKENINEQKKKIQIKDMIILHYQNKSKQFKMIEEKQKKIYKEIIQQKDKEIELLQKKEIQYKKEIQEILDKSQEMFDLFQKKQIQRVQQIPIEEGVL